jgi:hypothetical protein
MVLVEPLIDLRDWPAGGWDFAKMRVKVNGRWSYFFSADDAEPWNEKEPITFDEPYVPPNHQDEVFMPYAPIPVHPIRELFLARSQHSRAPLTSFDLVRTGKLRPAAWKYGTSVRRSQELPKPAAIVAPIVKPSLVDSKGVQTTG